jgi:hypothetical protein
MLLRSAESSVKDYTRVMLAWQKGSLSLFFCKSCLSGSWTIGGREGRLSEVKSFGVKCMPFKKEKQLSSDKVRQTWVLLLSNVEF